jgi:hypothetical protein
MAGLRKTSDNKNLKMHTVAILLVFIIVALTGCVDKPENPIDKASENLYVKITGYDGDPNEIIHDLDTIAYGIDINEQTGEQDPAIIRKCLTIMDEDGNIRIYNPLVDDFVSPEDMPQDWEIVKDSSGKPIEDIDQLPDYYPVVEKARGGTRIIHNLKDEVKDPDGGTWKKVYREGQYTDKSLVDNEIGDKYAEITGGLYVDKDGNAHGIIIANIKQNQVYDNVGATPLRGRGEAHYDEEIPFSHFSDMGNDLFMHVINLSALPEANYKCSDGTVIIKNLDVESLSTLEDDIFIAEEIGKYAAFKFELTES